MNGETKYIIAPDNCTGCSLCSNVCPHDAITMVWSGEGFLTPNVNLELCINCGICSNSCPAKKAPQNHQDEEAIEKVEAYGAWNATERARRESSSGGIFPELARKILEDGGCVFGAVWKDKLTVGFTKAETMDDVLSMRGSKYTMAVPGMVYREVKQELKQGRRVLFTGTPCQVAALYAYLRKPYDNLITMDIVCHGVPSRIILEKYVADAEKRTGKEVANINFRRKIDSWMRYSQTKYFTDGSEETTEKKEDPFMLLFLSDIALNKCCYNCRYAHFPRPGDLTLGDFWGVNNTHPDWPYQWGVSALLIRTETGRKAIEACGNSIVYLAVPFADIYKGQEVVYTRPDAPVHPRRSIFMQFANGCTIEDLHTLTFKPIAAARQFGLPVPSAAGPASIAAQTKAPTPVSEAKPSPVSKWRKLWLNIFKKRDK